MNKLFSILFLIFSCVFQGLNGHLTAEINETQQQAEPIFIIDVEEKERHTRDIPMWSEYGSWSYQLAVVNYHLTLSDGSETDIRQERSTRDGRGAEPLYQLIYGFYLDIGDKIQFIGVPEYKSNPDGYVARYNIVRGNRIVFTNESFFKLTP